MKRTLQKSIMLLPLLILSVIIVSFLLLNAGCSNQKISVKESETGDSAVNGTATEEKTAGEEDSISEEVKEPSYKLLYQLAGNRVSEIVTAGTKCYLLNFSEFLDGGIINPDGSDNKILNLKEYPTGLVTSKELTNYYYIYSPNNPCSEVHGFIFFNWDIKGQIMVTADFGTNSSAEISTSPSDRYPGDILASAGNRYLAYPMTVQKESSINAGSSFLMEKFNPHLSDSNLVIRNTENDQEKTVLENNYNRQLFSSFSQFSVIDNYFYTIAIENDSFKFIRVSLDTGEIKDFSKVFTYFDWSKISWNDFFPPSNDLSLASFSLSPDEERMVAYKNYYSATNVNTCSPEAFHKLWIFNLEDGRTDFFEKQRGYVTDISWNPYGSQDFSLSINSHSGCYPEYIDARIDIIDKNGDSIETIVTEQKSKITNLAWSQDGKNIAYDVYATDFVGRLKLIDLEKDKINELINTQIIEKTINKNEPVLIMLIDWVKE